MSKKEVDKKWINSVVKTTLIIPHNDFFAISLGLFLQVQAVVLSFVFEETRESLGSRFNVFTSLGYGLDTSWSERSGPDPGILLNEFFHISSWSEIKHWIIYGAVTSL